MLREEFLKTALPDRHTVLGVPLLPMSLGQQMLLEACGSPFVTDAGRTPELADLLTGILICSRPFEVSREAWVDGRFASEVEDAAAVLLRKCFWLRVRRWFRLTKDEFGPVQVLEAVAAFYAYAEGAAPKVVLQWNRDGEREVIELQTPSWYSLKTFLMERLHFTEAAALGTHYRTAMLNYATTMEREGVLVIRDQSEIAAEKARADVFAAFVMAGGNPREFKPCLN